jgi:putative PIN family toxin of toxin-antitoxin system
MTVRAVLDVNVFISSIIAQFGIPRRLWNAWRRGRFMLISSDPIIDTTVTRLRLPRIAQRYAVTEEQRRIFAALLRSRAMIVPILPEDVASITGDPEDDAVLATVRLGRAEYLVTGDHGLLDLGAYAGARIVSPRTFIALLDE